MGNLQVKNVPEPLVRQIRRLARRRGSTIREVVLDAVRREVAREEFRERLLSRTPVELEQPAARIIEELRQERDEELGR